MFHSVIRPMLQKMGVDLIRHGPSRRYPPMLRCKWMRDVHADLVLDVGANAGQYGAEVRHEGYQGGMISFEPVAATFEKLKAHAAGDANWKVRHNAVGAAPSRLTMNLSANTVSSSLLPMMDAHKDAAPGSEYVAKEEVDVITLDSLLGSEIRPTDRIWLKIDTQGYEFEVLAGAKGIMKQVQGLEVELSMVPLYEGTPLFEDALVQILNMGFKIAMLDEGFCDPLTRHVLQADGVFLRK